MKVTSPLINQPMEKGYLWVKNCWLHSHYIPWYHHFCWYPHQIDVWIPGIHGDAAISSSNFKLYKDVSSTSTSPLSSARIVERWIHIESGDGNPKAHILFLAYIYIYIHNIYIYTVYIYYYKSYIITSNIYIYNSCGITVYQVMTVFQ